jgi:hypothetical protein
MPSALEYRFSDMRMNAAAGVARPSFAVEINDDFGFSGYVYDMISWHSRLGFPGAERLYPLIGRRRELLLASFLLLAILYAVAALGSLGRPRRRIAIAAVLVAGFSGMAGGIAILVAFQVLCSALYQWVTILTGTFMAGAGAGSAFVAMRERIAGLPAISTKASKAALVHFLLLSLFTFLAVVLLMIERRPMPAWMIKPLFLFMEWTLGLFTGAAFVVACGVMGEGEEVAPVLYAFDLLGGCLGAALFAGIMLPLLGLPLGLLLLAGFNAVALAASGFSMRN